MHNTYRYAGPVAVRSAEKKHAYSNQQEESQMDILDKKKITLKILNCLIGVLAAVAGIALMSILLNKGVTFGQVLSEPFHWVMALVVGFGIDLFSDKKPKKVE